MSQAVLTGDIVGSSELTAEALSGLLESLTLLAADEGAAFGRYRGDGWQIYLAEAPRALRLTLQILAHLQGIAPPAETRIAIGIGTAELPPAGIAAGAGPAFETSGRLLDDLPARERLAIAGAGITPLHQALLAACGEIAGRWTRTQAEAVIHALDALGTPDDPPRHEDLAAELGLTRQAMQSRLSGAGWGTILKALAAWEAPS
ncbi:hypothetical protein ACXN5S_14815 [Pseudoroseicyclus sp. H15]